MFSHVYVPPCICFSTYMSPLCTCTCPLLYIFYVYVPPYICRSVYVSSYVCSFMCMFLLSACFLYVHILLYVCCSMCPPLRVYNALSISSLLINIRISVGINEYIPTGVYFIIYVCKCLILKLIFQISNKLDWLIDWLYH